MPTAFHGLTRAFVVALTLVIVTAACGAKVPPNVSTAPVPATPATQTPAPADSQPAVAAIPAPAPTQRADASPVQPVVAVPQAGTVQEKSEPAPIDQLLEISTTEKTVPATQELEKIVAHDLETTTYDIEIPLNDRVLSYVELFTGRLKGFLEEGLNRSARFLPMIQDVFRAEGLPLDLAYVPLIESAFKPNALSRAQAKGIWQFMHGTALENGLQHDWYIDERSDPEKATRAAAKYLKTLYGMFDDWHLALASYNGGPGRVQRAIDRSGRTDFWQLSESTRYLPRETCDYVPLILAAVIIARNPTQYGMNIEPIEAPAFETVTLARAVDLRRIAEWTGASVETIQDLNPELRRWTTPLRSTAYGLKVPMGSASVVGAHMAGMASDDLASLNHYTVKKGETMLGIAKKLRVTRSDLAEANYLSTRATLRAGQKLIIPREPALVVAARQETAPSRAAVRSDTRVDAVNASNTLSSRSPARIESTKPVRVTHRVRQGETLFAIALKYDTTVQSLKEWNHLRGNVIKAGQRLTIYQRTAVATD
ncbi:MAG TPA: LysM peptidoglycan-binding domain-containing protein [Vicinamibacterales bacterium]|nr:LysM peptidoglycan-binding domain-containing protein [Vicinamibacterales bacterium]